MENREAKWIEERIEFYRQHYGLAAERLIHELLEPALRLARLICEGINE